jgi:nucleoside-diphosphate-sugar epimerase
MKVLITGNLGYIGPYLGRYLKERYPSMILVGLDAGFFFNSITVNDQPIDRFYDVQHYGDVRDLRSDFVKGFDAIVNLAAISNDPMGNQFEKVTDQINRESVIKIAKEAAKQSVKSVVFASSCSMYGAASDKPKTENDLTNPLTAYARSKIGVEEGLLNEDLNGTIFTALRFSTACGFTPRTRLDLVLNDFVVSAMNYKKISILSDGTPWRPLIHVHDMCRAIDWAIHRDDIYNNIRSINIGSNNWNYQVKDLARAVADHVGNVEVNINLDAPPDKRSYQVDFSLYEKIAPNHQPVVMLNDAIEDLFMGLQNVKIVEDDFRKSKYIRLQVLQHLMSERIIDSELRYM